MEKFLKASLLAVFCLFATSALAQPLPTINPSPTCYMQATPDLVNPNEQVVLLPTLSGPYWTFYIDQDVGLVTTNWAFVSTPVTKTYMGTITGPTGSSSCWVTVFVRAQDWLGTLSVQLKDVLMDTPGNETLIKSGDFPLTFNLTSGYLNSDYSQSYNGDVSGYKDSWVYVNFIRNVQPGYSKFAQVSAGFTLRGKNVNVQCSPYVKSDDKNGSGLAQITFTDPMTGNNNGYSTDLATTPIATAMSQCIVTHTPPQNCINYGDGADCSASGNSGGGKGVPAQ